MEKHIKTLKLFNDKKKTIDEIRNHLRKFMGGCVNLSKTSDGLAIVTLNHESKRNAISGKMMVDLSDVVEELESWTEGKGVILKGAGGNFCSGGDLDFAKQTGTPEEGFMMSKFMNNILHRFQSLPLISAALIEGIGALGGGAELSLACDYRIISEKCQGIGFVHAKMNIIPAWGGTTRLVKKIGYSKALDVLSKARILHPLECLQLGLVDDIIPSHNDNIEYIIAWIRERIKFKPEIIRSIKMACFIAQDNQDSYKIETQIFAPFWGSPGNREALAANIKHKSKIADEK